MEDVPPSLVINWDHTATKTSRQVSGQWRRKQQILRVEIATVDDKRQIPAIFICTLSGKFLPIQLIYKGTTTKCHPKAFHSMLTDTLLIRRITGSMRQQRLLTLKAL